MRLLHIRDAIGTIRSYVTDEASFLASPLVQDAVIRNLEIIGEATKAIDPQLRSRRSDIPWAQVAGLRDRLIHGYFTVDPRLVWHVVRNELASLDDAVTDLLRALPDSDTPL